jgi:hypothetical protein
MSLRLLSLTKLLSLVLGLLILGACAPKAKFTTVLGSSAIIKKIKPVSKTIKFRTGSEYQILSIKSLKTISFNRDSTDVYNGKTWIYSSLTYAKQEDSTVTTGWVLPTETINGKLNKNDYSVTLFGLSEIDLNFEEEIVDSTTDSLETIPDTTAEVSEPTTGEDVEKTE